jgi:hypothetical protein
MKQLIKQQNTNAAELLSNFFCDNNPKKPFAYNRLRTTSSQTFGI